MPDIKRGRVTADAVNAGQAEDDARMDKVEVGDFFFATFTVATLPAAAARAGRVVRVSDGAAGAACLAMSNGTSWLRVPLGAAVSTTV